MTQISWETTTCVHQRCEALPTLIPTSALYISTFALVCWQVNQGGGPRVETFASRRDLLLRQLTQEGGQDSKDDCP